LPASDPIARVPLPAPHLRHTLPGCIASVTVAVTILDQSTSWLVANPDGGIADGAQYTSGCAVSRSGT
jgi:hypothetical protein